MNPRVRSTLCFIILGNEVLLGMKKRGLGAGNLNGFGGKLKDGELFDVALQRELREEADVELVSYGKCGEILFTLPNGDELETHVYRATEISGEPKETEEMCPERFPLAAMPYDRMWRADHLWLPLLLAGKKFEAVIRYGEGFTILEHKITEVG